MDLAEQRFREMYQKRHITSWPASSGATQPHRHQFAARSATTLDSPYADISLTTRRVRGAQDEDSSRTAGYGTSGDRMWLE